MVVVAVAVAVVVVVVVVVVQANCTQNFANNQVEHVLVEESLHQLSSSKFDS